MKNKIKHSIIANMPYELLHFLVNHNKLAFHQFVTNTVNYIIKHNLNVDEYIWDRYIPNTNIIDIAFLWQESAQRYAYWVNISWKYDKYLRSKEINNYGKQKTKNRTVSKFQQISNFKYAFKLK